jgi:hypothetical protein
LLKDEAVAAALRQHLLDERARRAERELVAGRRRLVQLDPPGRDHGTVAPQLVFVVAHRRAPPESVPVRLRAARLLSVRMTELPLTGGCLCGGVRFELDAPPESASYCHCTRCQRRTGTAASAQARVAAGSLRVVTGEELVREYAPADGWAKCFCGVCGSALWSRDPGSGAMSVRLGAFDGDPGVRPQYRQYVTYAATWEPLPDDDLPRFPERRPAV